MVRAPSRIQRERARANAARPRGASVELDSRLEGASLTIEDFLSLQEGDLLEFDHPLERPLDCLVNGKLKFKGQVVSLAHRMGFRIE